MEERERIEQDAAPRAERAQQRQGDAAGEHASDQVRTAPAAQPAPAVGQRAGERCYHQRHRRARRDDAAADAGLLGAVWPEDAGDLIGHDDRHHRQPLRKKGKPKHRDEDLVDCRKLPGRGRVDLSARPSHGCPLLACPRARLSLRRMPLPRARGYHVPAGANNRKLQRSAMTSEADRMDMPPRQAVIFESYGWGDAADIARRIKASLEEAGYEVWIDSEIISPDEADFWKPLEAALGHCELVVALLSPHSRRLEGDLSASPWMSICHNELIMAVQMRKTVVPATVIECRPPLAIAHYDPIDFTKWPSSPEAYRAGIEEILHWIREGLSKPEPRRRYSAYVANLSHDRLSFPEELAAKDSFVGREWLMGRLEAWLESDGEKCFLIEAEPGSGKTALVAEQLRRNDGDRILAYHFCNSQNRDTVDPRRFVRSIAAMLCGTVRDYRNLLGDPNLVDVLNATTTRGRCCGRACWNHCTTCRWSARNTSLSTPLTRRRASAPTGPARRCRSRSYWRGHSPTSHPG
jgi:TIR domain